MFLGYDIFVVDCYAFRSLVVIPQYDVSFFYWSLKLVKSMFIAEGIPQSHK